MEPSQKGSVVAIVGGLGLISFLDLIAYIFRLNANKIGEDTGNSYRVFENEIFDQLTDPSFRFVLFTSFKSNREVPLYDLIKSLEKVCKISGMKNFELRERFSNKSEKHWTKEFFQAHLPKDISKILLVGGKEFVESIRKILLECQIDKSFICEV